MTEGRWIAVDLDGTLAWTTGDGSIGAPVKPMWARVRQWLAEGTPVRILTARAGDPAQVHAIRAWLRRNRLPQLPITNVKTEGMLELWDDRAVRVTRNTGEVCAGCAAHGKKAP
jgi:hypothetical protein